MTFLFEVDPGLESLSGMRGVEYFGDDYEAAVVEGGYRELGIDPRDSTEAKPGSDEKVLMLAARYASGMPLWHSADCYDHGPGEGIDLEEDAFEDD